MAEVVDVCFRFLYDRSILERAQQAIKCFYTGRHSRSSNKWIDSKTMKGEGNKEEHQGPITGQRTIDLIEETK